MLHLDNGDISETNYVEHLMKMYIVGGCLYEDWGQWTVDKVYEMDEPVARLYFEAPYTRCPASTPILRTPSGRWS